MSAEKIKRSRLACSACRSTKQKCDGESRVPCRRCELYGLECLFTPTGRPKQQPAAASTPYSYPKPAGDVSNQLEEISQRLKSIESSLGAVHLSNQASSSTSTFPSTIHRQSSDAESVTSSIIEDSSAARGDGSDPLRIVKDTIDRLESTKKSLSQSPPESRVYNDVGGPDALKRGLITIPEAIAIFEFTLAKIQPWIMFDLDLGSPPTHDSVLNLRSESPLLFHVILLTASYYTISKGDSALRIYYGLTAIVNELLAPSILSPQSSDLNTNFIRALTFLNLWKPVQFIALARDFPEPHLAEQASKINSSASSLIGGLIRRLVDNLALASAPNRFSTHFSPSSPVIKDLRLFYWLLSMDAHGALQNGKPTMFDDSDAIKSTRMFASLKLQPGDIKLAAMVEICAVTRPIIGILASATKGKRTLSVATLKKYDEDMSRVEEYWSDLLKPQRDGIRFTTITFSNFSRTVILAGSIFNYWLRSINEGERAELSLVDWALLQRGIEAAELVIFSATIESRTEDGWRKVDWGTESAGRVLNVDPDVLETHRFGPDTVPCVMFVYPLLTLARMASEGILRCDLTLRTDLSSQTLLQPSQQRIYPKSKLHSLLQFGIKFLLAIAPTPNHPANQHAETIRSILDRGLQGWAPSTTRGTTTPVVVNGAVKTDVVGNLSNDLIALLPAEQFLLPSYLLDPSSSSGGIVGGDEGVAGGLEEYLVPVSHESIFDPIDWEELEAGMDFNM